MARYVPTGNVWPISKAKANFAAFLRAAEREPQIITVRGVEKAVIMMNADAKRLGFGEFYPPKAED